MDNKKVIFVDVDQTLYDNKRQILYPSTKRILEELSKREDIDLFLATGRTCATVSHLKEVWDYFKGFVMNNGQTVIVNDKVIYERPIPKEIVDRLEEYANNRRYHKSDLDETHVIIHTIFPYTRKMICSFMENV